MAFMLPVVKNDYDIYAGKSRRTSSASIPRSRRSTRCSESNPPSLSCSPGSDVDERLSAVMRVNAVISATNHHAHSNQTAESRSRSGSQLAESPKSASQSSLHKFHNRLVDKLKRTLKIKDDSDHGDQPSTSRKSLVPSS